MKSNMHYLSAGIALSAAFLFPQLAEAHVAHGGHNGLLVGLMHPLSGWDHVLAMVAVGIWAAQLGTPAVRALPFAFPLLMAVGGFIGLRGIPLPGIESGIALSAVVLGAAVLLRYRAPLKLAVPIVAFFGLLHGHAHGAELPPGQDAFVFSLGFIVGTGLLHATGIAFGLGCRRRWHGLALRGAGAGVLAGGMTFLWSAVA